MAMMKKLREFFVYLSVFISLLKVVALAQEVSFDLEGGSQYEIAWVTRDEVSVPKETVKDKVQTQLLPNMLLGEGQWPAEAMMIRTVDNEEYTCLLPSSTTDGNSEVSDRPSVSNIHTLLL